jgi:DNA-binding NarL/FixJ family response regulator
MEDLRRSVDDQDMVPTRPIRVFLCDDSAPFRSLLRLSLAEDPDIEVVGEAGDGESGVTGAVEAKADVVLLDLAMPKLDGMGALDRLREQLPSAAVIVLSGFTADRMSQAISGLGAAGYLEKGAEVEEIVAAVRDAFESTRPSVGVPA